jgi:hypothetical protein
MLRALTLAVTAAMTVFQLLAVYLMYENARSLAELLTSTVFAVGMALAMASVWRSWYVAHRRPWR